MDEGRWPNEEQLILLALAVRPDLNTTHVYQTKQSCTDTHAELRLTVGHDLPLLGDLLADQDGPHVRLHQGAISHVAHPEHKSE